MTTSALMHLIRTHWLAIGVALAASIIVSSPLIAFPFVAGEQYQGINIMQFGNDEHYYLSRMREALDGNAMGQPFLRERKDEQDSTFSYVERVLAAPLRLIGWSGMNVVTFYNILNAVGVFTLVLVIYAYALRLTENTFLSIGAAVFVICGYTIIETKSLFFATPDIYGRSLFPFASSIPFIGFLIALYDAVVEERGWKSTVAAAALLGLLMYTYFFAWTFAFALIGSLGLISLVTRNWRAVKTLCIIGFSAFCVGAWNVVQLFTYFSSPMGDMTSFYQASVKSHRFILSKIGLGTLVLAAVSGYVRGKDKKTHFVWGLMLAGWIALNQQVFSGRLIQYGHYYWYFIVPLSIVVAVYFAGLLIPKKWHKIFGCLLIAIALINGIGQQYRAFQQSVPARLHEQMYAPVLAKLKELPKGVVLENVNGSTESFLITIYTSDDAYWIPAAELHASSPNRLREALELELYLNKDSRQHPSDYLRDALKKNESNEYTSMYEELEGVYSGLDYYAYHHALSSGTTFDAVRTQQLDALQHDYAAHFGSPQQVEKLLDTRDVRYVIWDTKQNPEWDLSAIKSLTHVATSGDLILFTRDR